MNIPIHSTVIFYVRRAQYCRLKKRLQLTIRLPSDDYINMWK